MQITSVNVRKIEKDGSRMKGIATVLLDDAFAVHDIRIIEGDNGLFIAMPSRKTPDGEFKDIHGRVARIAGQQRVIVELFDEYLVATAYVPREAMKLYNRI